MVLEPKVFGRLFIQADDCDWQNLVLVARQSQSKM
jgi:hypothetical protein